MERKKWRKRWRRLDNTAKIFPVIANEQMSQVFRISVTLKEPVDPDILQQALEDILPHIRNFRVKLRRGLFWYYFEENTRIPGTAGEYLSLPVSGSSWKPAFSFPGFLLWEPD